MDIGNRARAFLGRVWKEGGGVGSPRNQGLEKISVFELGRPRARMGNPNTGIPETLVQDIYDIYFVAAGSAMGKLTLFSLPIGSTYNFNGVTAFQKGFDHTYLTQQGMLDSSFSYVIRAIAFYVQALQGSTHPLLHPEDLNNLTSSYAEFQVNRKPWLSGLCGWYPCAGGPMFSGLGTLTAPTSSFSSSNGLPYRNNAYALPGGLFINPQENFNFVIDPTQNAGGTPSALAAAGNPTGVPAAGLSMWARLMGQLVRVA
jgi:hypothetical protein